MCHRVCQTFVDSHIFNPLLFCLQQRKEVQAEMDRLHKTAAQVSNDARDSFCTAGTRTWLQTAGRAEALLERPQYFIAASQTPATLSTVAEMTTLIACRSIYFPKIPLPTRSLPIRNF